MATTLRRHSKTWDNVSAAWACALEGKHAVILVLELPPSRQLQRALDEHMSAALVQPTRDGYRYDFGKGSLEVVTPGEFIDREPKWTVPHV